MAAVIIAAIGISTINLFTVFGIIRSPDVLTYAVMVAIYMMPLVLIAAILHKAVFEEKYALERTLRAPKEGAGISTDNIRLVRGERVMVSMTSHPGFFFKVALACVLSVSVGISSLYMIPPLLESLNAVTFLSVLIPILLLCTVIHFFSKNIFDPGSWDEFMEHAWISLLAISVSISLLMTLNNYITSTYPREFWERFLGLPFSLPALMFLVMMLLVGGILIRMGDIFRFEGGPLRSSGIVFVLVSITFMVPMFQFINWELLLDIISRLFSLTLISYGVLTGLLLYRDAGMRFLVTNKRVIKYNTHRYEKSHYFPLSRMRVIYVKQDFLAKYLGYGNVVMLFALAGKKAQCVYHGVNHPSRVAKSIKALKRKTKGVRKKPHVKKPKRNFYYRMVAPLVVLALLLPAMPAHASSPGEYMVSEYVITYLDPTSFTVDGSFEIHSYVIHGTTMYPEDIRALYHGGQEDEIEEIMMGAVTSLLNTFIVDSYRIEEGRGMVFTAVILENMDAPPQDPISLTSHTSVDLTNEFFGLPPEARAVDVIDGVLKVGGKLNHNIILSCPPGHETSYIFRPPENMVLDGTTQYYLHNLEGSETLSETAEFGMVHEDPVYVEDDLHTSLLFDIHEIERRDDCEILHVDILLDASFTGMGITGTMREHMPTQLEMDRVNTALIRLFYQNGFSDPVDAMLERLESEMRHLVSEVGEVVTPGELMIENLHMDYDPQTMDPYPTMDISFRSSVERKRSEDPLTASIPTRYSVSESVSMNVRNPSEWAVEYKVMAPAGIDIIRARMDEPLVIGHNGRDYAAGQLQPGQEGTLVIEMGTEIDLMEFVPFAVIIIILLFTWIALILYRPKRRRRR